MAALNRLRTDRPVRWTTLLGLLLVPLTVAGALLWGLWNPTERLDTVTAAVVNLDEPVTLDGQTVPLGRVLAAGLIGGETSASDAADTADESSAQTNFDWQLTDESDAADGLADGRYTAVVTIPKDFSSAATSASKGADAVEQARIDVRTSERGRLLDGALANIVTTTATGVLNEQLGTQSVDQLFVGMNEIGGGVRKIAVGANKLATGGSKLADGADDLSDGAGELSDGLGEYVDGVGGVSTGVSGLADGSTRLATGTAELATGTEQLATGVAKLSRGASKLSTGAGQLSTGARRAAEGGQALATGVTEYTGGVDQAITGLQRGGAAAADQLQQYRDLIEGDVVPMPDPATKAQAIAGLDTLIANLQGAASSSAKNPLNVLKATGAELADGAKASAKGQKQLAAGMKQTAGGVRQVSGGLTQLAEQVPALADGASELASGTSELASGTSRLADGAAQLAVGGTRLGEGASQLSTGTRELASGARASADGSQQLARGLDTAASQIPRNDKDQREALAAAMIRPVQAEGGDDELFTASGVPLFAGIALWAGALAGALVLAPLWRRTREAARGIGFITLRSAAPVVGLGAVQGLIAGAVLPPLLGYDLSQWFGFLGLAVAAGVSFALVNQGLSALLGGFGRFLSFALLAVAFAIGVVSTAPPLLQAIGDASPVGALFAGFQAIAMGGSGSGAALALLLLWGVGGLVLTALAVARERRRGPSPVAPATPAAVAA